MLIYCTDDPTADMLARLLTVDQVKAVLISERNQENEMIARMEQRQVVQLARLRTTDAPCTLHTLVPRVLVSGNSRTDERCMSFVASQYAC